MANFTPLSAAIGGALIGLAAALLMVLSGRIAGIAGIFGEALSSSSDSGWRIAFMAGLIVAPLAAMAAGVRVPAPLMPDSWIVVAIGGLLVGFGTRLAAGCTSGHGICGIARLSPRSLVATAVFMAAAMIVVFISRHILGA
jgi:uncharacterized membrane protein YedE/YeeE